MATRRPQGRPVRHTDVAQEPRRGASRLEGVVKNRGTRAQKKPKRSNG